MEVKRRAGGKLFHARGSATANARSPRDARRVDGTTRSEVDAERSRRRAALPTDTVESDKYPGAAPFKQPCTSTHNLYWMRCGTHSQCKSIRSCVTWSYLRASAVRRAAALTTDCTLSSSCLHVVSRHALRVRSSALSTVRCCQPSHPQNPVSSVVNSSTSPPALYLLNAAGLAEPHAVQHLCADLMSNNCEVVVNTETHFKSKHSDVYSRLYCFQT